ncbi:DUF1634 domain-containing protein [Manganibacter manganicus]|uniref:DUF1634 domain-containing protein n=1 Tax=Manganibacter manganicus TaxID=1873176 RepID=A0A1V8RTW1_9HYPH|nr:DUF1634 domain-containing protein [Pseudaminobacter manganicus]OQM76605.1 hypothetical protein BFN67_13305 [Pseudaminobacter manganicus]
MRSGTDNYERREQLIAGLLWYGTWLASAVIAAGIALAMLEKAGIAPGFALSGYDVVKAGVALFILLPIARVGLMLVIFLRERDYVYTAISALVLAIIGVGVLVAL